MVCECVLHLGEGGADKQTDRHNTQHIATLKYRMTLSVLRTKYRRFHVFANPPCFTRYPEYTVTSSLVFAAGAGEALGGLLLRSPPPAV